MTTTEDTERFKIDPGFLSFLLTSSYMELDEKQWISFWLLPATALFPSTLGDTFLRTNYYLQPVYRG